ncbi:MAG: hypothetical protein V3T64_10680 [Myxococcota bacterium]
MCWRLTDSGSSWATNRIASQARIVSSASDLDVFIEPRHLGLEPATLVRHQATLVIEGVEALALACDFDLGLA